MDIRKVKKLIELLEQSNVAEIEIREGEESVRINRQGTGVQPLVMAAPPQAQPAPGVAYAPPPAIADPTPALSADDRELEENLVRSPMVGTFFSAQSPGAKPFVQEGQQVKTGDILCIIEAMKILNQIECERAGTIRKILVENGQPVEYDQPLFAID